jgi:hypothetical protein
MQCAKKNTQCNCANEMQCVELHVKCPNNSCTQQTNMFSTKISQKQHE